MKWANQSERVIGEVIARASKSATRKELEAAIAAAYPNDPKTYPFKQWCDARAKLLCEESKKRFAAGWTDARWKGVEPASV